MFSYLMTAFTALLFVVLTPGILVTLPSKASDKIVVALVHGLIFALVYHLIHKAVWGALHKYEGFDDECLAYDKDGNCIEHVDEGFVVKCSKYDEEGNCIQEDEDEDDM